MENVRVVLRPLASAMPMGFFAVGAASMTLAGLDLGWIPRSEQLEVGLTLVVLTALPLPIASILAFLARDAAVGTALGVQAVAWGIQGLVLAVGAPTATSKAAGTVLLVLCAATLASAAEAAASKAVAGLVLAATGARFLLTAIYQLGGGKGVGVASGIVGIAVTAIAVYAAIALGLEDIRGQAVLPVGRRGEGAHAMSGDIAE